MSEPRTKYEDPIAGALYEVTSAMSALNMEPRTFVNATGPYLIDTDYWAKHAHEHLFSALVLLMRAQALHGEPS